MEAHSLTRNADSVQQLKQLSTCVQVGVSTCTCMGHESVHNSLHFLSTPASNFSAKLMSWITERNRGGHACGWDMHILSKCAQGSPGKIGVWWSPRKSAITFIIRRLIYKLNMNS